MKVSILFLATLSVALFLHTLHYSEASELSQLLDREIQELKDAIEKRGKRKPCGFTWNVKKCRRRGRRGRFWGKRNGISHQSTSFSSFGSDVMDELLNDNIINKE